MFLRKEGMKKPSADTDGLLYPLHRAGNFSGSDASGANVLLDDGAVFLDSDGLNICVPLSSGMTIGVGYVVTGNLALATDLALS